VYLETDMKVAFYFINIIICKFYTHTHTHIYIYIYIYILLCFEVGPTLKVHIKHTSFAQGGGN